MICPNCGVATDPDARFCQDCGKPVAGQKETDNEAAGSGVPPGPTGVVGPLLSSGSGQPSHRPSRWHYLWVLLGIVGGIAGWLTVRDRDRRMGQRILVGGGIITGIGIAISVIVSVAALSVTTDIANSYNASAPVAGGTTNTTSSTITTPAPIVEAGAFTNTWSFKATASNGYSMDGTLQIGAPQHFVTGLTTGNATIRSACGINSQTDAVIPVQLTVENTTPNFSEPIGVNVIGIGSTTFSFIDHGLSMEWKGQYTNQAICATSTSTQNNGFGVEGTSATPSRSSTTVDGFLVLTDYYTPADPRGDIALLAQTVLGLSTNQTAGSGGPGEMAYTITSVTGPGVRHETDEWLFTLAGTAPVVSTTSHTTSSSTATKTAPTTSASTNSANTTTTTTTTQTTTTTTTRTTVPTATSTTTSPTKTAPTT